MSPLGRGAASLVIAVAALLLASGARAAEAGPPGPPPWCVEWWGSGTEPYPYPLGGLPANLPECRVGRAGAEDLGTEAWALRDGRRLSMRRRFGSLEANPDEGGRVRWPLVDSLGRTLAVLERHADHWATSDPDTGEVIFRDFTLDPGVLSVQGRGCMVDEGLEARHALVAFPVHDRVAPPRDEGVVPYQIRAFLDRRALPAGDARRRPIRDAVDLYRVGCGESPAPGGPLRLHDDPGFDGRRHQFRGEDGMARTYATYNVKRRYRGARYLLVNTTGVHGGGIVRGVLRADDPVSVVDALGYCDPNAVGGEPVATWSLVRLPGTRLEGWLPNRCGA